MEEQQERKDIKLAEKALERLEKDERGTLRELLKDYGWQDVSQTIKMQTGLRFWEQARINDKKLKVLGKKNGATIYELLS